jgi:hypothetical protein
MPALIPSSLPVILQTVEQQLLNYVSPITGNPVAGDISNIYWIFPEEEPPPGTTGQRDILFAVHPDKATNVQGAGRFTELASGFDVYLRSTLAADRRGTRRDFMIAHRLLIDALMDSIMGFFPVDGSSNALTIEGLVINENARPSKTRAVETWGMTIGSYKFHYIPNINLGLVG